MLIVSQNKEKVLWFGRAFNTLEYTEPIPYEHPLGAVIWVNLSKGKRKE